jgi:hypothetical protein
MIKQAIFVTFLLALAAPACARQETGALAAALPGAGEPGPEQVLVVGQRPGPGLWKISKGDNVLWVFATYSPLPLKMEWRAQQVEAIIAQSQEFLTPPSAGVDVGFWRGVTLLPHVIGLNKNPENALLSDVVPADVYARWRELKSRYGLKDDVERERPLFAAERLYRAALQQAGLSTTDQVTKSITALVKKNGLKVTSSHVKLEADNLSGAIKDWKKSGIDDGPCFARTIERIETDIDAMRVRANAWAKGDLAVIRKLGYPDREGACKAAMDGAPAIRAMIGDQQPEQRMRKLWLEAAERALANNRSTFAVLSLTRILKGNDLVADLQARGYTVEAPE